ncbi:hypothetical protein [Vibrio sp. YQ_10]|uniref:hypothetical protein n=1 Tax=Vibrio sp. YQ_10 TaxID=3367232 RepID=UPI00370C1999
MSANKLEVQLSADIIQFERGIDEAKRSLRVYSGAVGKTEKDQAGLNKQFALSRKQMENYGRGLTNVAGITTAAFAGTAAAAVAHTRVMADQAREFERQATVAQVSVEQIQALGYASEQYNIAGDKMADILKDVNDKLGDFTENEGGEFADFMKNIAPTVGLTIEKLQKLSGPDALIAVKTAMDQANVPMKSQLFYLESIANDASALMPLLENKGKRLYDLTQHYKDLNVAMSQYDIQQYKQMDQQITDMELKMSRAFGNLSRQVTYSLLPTMDDVNGYVDALTKGVRDYTNQIEAFGMATATLNVFSGTTMREKHREIFSEMIALQEELKEYEGVDINKLPSINPFGKSRNEWFNLQRDLAMKRDELKALNDKVVEQQKRWASNFDYTTLIGNGDTPKATPNPNPLPPVDSKGEDKRVAAFRDATDQMQVEWQRRLALYAAGDQKEATQEVFAYQDKITRLKESFQTAHDAASADKQLQQELESEHFAARELLWQEHQDNLARIESEQQLLRDEQNQDFWDRYLESLQENMMNMDELTAGMLNNFSSGVGNAFESMIYDSQSLGNAFENLAVGMGRSVVNALGQMAAQWLAYQVVQMAVGKSTAAASAVSISANAKAASLQAGLNAYASTAAIPILGPAAAPAAMEAALAVTGPVALSIDALVAGGVAGMAHSGISEIPAEGTWLLNKGERVYTNQSANQLDLMFNAIMAMHRKTNAISDPSLAYQNRMAGNGGPASTQPWNIIIHDAEPGTRAEIDDESKVINIMMKDAQSGGQYYSYISKTLGVQPGGFK